MTGQIIDLSAARAAREREEHEGSGPHWSGNVRCIGCWHEWVAVAPVGSYWLECPACGFEKGAPVYAMSAELGTMVLTCDCGCEAMMIYRGDDRLTRVLCMRCGDDMTEAVFG